MNLSLVEKLIRTASLQTHENYYEYTLGDGFASLRSMEEQFLIGINLMLQNQNKELKSCSSLRLLFTTKDKQFKVLGQIMSTEPKDKVCIELGWDKGYRYYLDQKTWDLCCLDKGFHPSYLSCLTIS